MLPCPVCHRVPLIPGQLHTHTVCDDCLSRATDSIGQLLELKIGHSADEGVYALYRDTGELYGPYSPFQLPIWIDGVPCTAFYRDYGVHILPAVSA